MKLTENFTLSEMVKSETALRHGLDNTPGDVEIANLRQLAANVLQPIRNHYRTGVKVNSGYRAPNVNAAVGGSRTSDHTRGQAADIEIPGIANAALAEWISKHLKFTQLILEAYTKGIPDSGWVHVSYNPDNLKCEVLTATFVNGKAQYSKGLNY
jgi:zinc D-Ala-D-Ala carboxypeptidase